jgi:RND family efflux transporter MFP subunit
MTGESRLNVSRPAAVAIVLLLLGAGAGGMWLVTRNRTAPSGQAPSAAATAPAALAGTGSLPDVVVPLNKDAAERAGIVVTPVTSQGMTGELRLPGAVEPNAYRQVSVTPLVVGRVVRVFAQLGDRVKRGQAIAQVYSPEIAEARTKYVAARAMLDAHDRELKRTEKLVTIGAASRQELERVHAEHTAQAAEVESARSRLQLLGATPAGPAGAGSDANATTDVPAPIDGVITERLANDGLNVEPATKLFVIVDLSNVWVIGSAYERDLPHIREGARATVRARAFPDRAFEGRVGYVDPQLNEGTRTAKVRVEVANPRAELRLGMYADVVIAATGGAALTVPRSAIQNVGSRQVVYLSSPADPGKFIEREVLVGRSVGEVVEVLSGLAAGDAVVSQGSFFVRAETDRLGLRSQVPATSGRSGRGVQSATIVVSDTGYEPATVSLRAGVPARLTFMRTSDKTCGTEIVFPSLNIKRALPLNQSVTIDLTPSRTEDITFTCGMNMLKGTVVVR